MNRCLLWWKLTTGWPGALGKTQTWMVTLEPDIPQTDFNLYLEPAFWLEAENGEHQKKRWSESTEPFKAELISGSFFERNTCNGHMMATLHKPRPTWVLSMVPAESKTVGTSLLYYKTI